MGSHPKLSIWGCLHCREGRTSFWGEPEDDLSFHCPVYCFPAPHIGYTYLATWLEEPCLPQAYSCTLHTSSISATTRCKRNNKSIQGMQHMFYKGYFTLEVSTVTNSPCNHHTAPDMGCIFCQFTVSKFWTSYSPANNVRNTKPFSPLHFST